jgi:hypothetical protein
MCYFVKVGDVHLTTRFQKEYLVDWLSLPNLDVYTGKCQSQRQLLMLSKILHHSQTELKGTCR